MVTWEGFGRTLGGWDHPIPPVKLAVWSWHVLTISPRHSLGGEAKTLVYFAGMDRALVWAQPRICSGIILSSWELLALPMLSLVSALADEALTQSCGIFRPCFNTATCQWIHESGHRQLPPAAPIWGPACRLRSQAVPRDTAFCAASFLVCLPLGRHNFQMFHFATCLFCFLVCVPGWLWENERVGLKLIWEVGCPPGQALLHLLICLDWHLLPTGSWALTRAWHCQGWALRDVSSLPASLVPDQWLCDSVMSSARVALREAQPHSWPQKAQWARKSYNVFLYVSTPKKTKGKRVWLEDFLKFHLGMESEELEWKIRCKHFVSEIFLCKFDKINNLRNSSRGA